MYYINYFFIFSIIGHLIETFFVPNFNSGILYGWWTPVYGFGVVIILLIGKLIDKINLKQKLIFKIILTYFISMILLTIIELLGGYLIEWFFHKTFWNYEDYRFNIGKYIALEVSNTWGIASIAVLYLLKPIVDKFIKKIPKWITYTIIGLFIIDNLCTLILK